MKVAFDTSVLIAAIFPSHPHHARALCWLEAAREGTVDGVMALHAVAEVWAKLTVMPGCALSSRDAAEVIDRLKMAVAVTAPDDALYADAVSRCVNASAKSGAIYDAIHLASARLDGADVMLTFNEKDFVRFVRAGDPRVVAPPDPPGLLLPL